MKIFGEEHNTQALIELRKAGYAITLEELIEQRKLAYAEIRLELAIRDYPRALEMSDEELFYLIDQTRVGLLQVINSPEWN